ncbi:hypothetical protein ACFLZO_00250 [Patescibacteria group bacterium]
MRKEQIDNMIIFSNKALFAEKGGADLLEKWAESGDDKETIRAEIEDWVRRQIKERAIEEKKHTELKDQLAEVHVRVWSADRKIHTLEKALEEKTGENEGLIAELALMRKEKEIAEKDKAEIIRLRGEVAGQQEDQQEAA